MTGTSVGQRVLIDPVAHEELTWQQLGRPYTIVRVVGDGDDAMCSLKDDGGHILKWIRANEFLPARAVIKPSELPRIVEREEPMQMSLETEVLTLATDYQKRLHLSAAQAAKKAGADVLTTEKKQDAYRGLQPTRKALRSPTENQVRAEIEDVIREYGCSAEEAADIIILLAGATKFEERVLQLKADGLDASTALSRAQREDPTGAEHYRLRGLL
jgi:hypothetical protein